jgi:hypothetical protein
MYDGAQWGLLKKLIITASMIGQAAAADNGTDNQGGKGNRGGDVGFWEWVRRIYDLLVLIYMIIFLVFLMIGLGCFIVERVRVEIREWSAIIQPRVPGLIGRVNATSEFVTAAAGRATAAAAERVSGAGDRAAAAATRVRDWVEPRIENARNQWQRVGARFFGAADGHEPQEEPSPERDERGERIDGAAAGYETPRRRRNPLSSPNVIRESRDESQRRANANRGWRAGEAAASTAPAAAAAELGRGQRRLEQECSASRNLQQATTTTVPEIPVGSPPAADIPPAPTPSPGASQREETPRARARRARRTRAHKIITDRHHEWFHLNEHCDLCTIVPPVYKLPCGACAPQEEGHLTQVFVTFHGEKYHQSEECWGLRNATSSIQMKRACRECAAGLP